MIIGNGCNQKNQLIENCCLKTPIFFLVSPLVTCNAYTDTQKISFIFCVAVSWPMLWTESLKFCKFRYYTCVCKCHITSFFLRRFRSVHNWHLCLHSIVTKILVMRSGSHTRICSCAFNFLQNFDRALSLSCRSFTWIFFQQAWFF